MVREPVVAGQFYPDSASQLEAMVKMLVSDKVEKEEVIGILSPHAGYLFSGPVAGSVFSRIKFKETFIIMGPNHTGKGHPFSIMTAGIWKTPLGEVEIDSELAKQILATSDYLQEDSVAHQYEHSVEVQLPFLQYFKPDIRIVPISFAQASAEAYKEIGKAVATAVKDLEREVVLVASSDMTHYEPVESARRKDGQAIAAVLALDEDELLKRVEELNISMCGYAPTVSLITAAKELGAKRAEVVRYQTSGDATHDYSSVVGYAGVVITATGMYPLVKLAKKTVEAYVKDGQIPGLEEFTPEMAERAGVFVSIYKFGALRGCIGTFQPQVENVAAEVVGNAINSATRDPRFPSVTRDELEQLSYSVDVLSAPEPVKGKEQLNPQRYGVIIECGPRRGLLLPSLEGVDSADQQIDICRQKAGIAPDERVKLYRFEVRRYK
jgi:MEMO1 family protein